jgi:hypothetical protein
MEAKCGKEEKKSMGKSEHIKWRALSQNAKEWMRYYQWVIHPAVNTNRWMMNTVMKYKITQKYSKV